MSEPLLRLHDGFPHTSPELRGRVCELQEALAHYDPEVTIDGTFDSATERAVRRFQRARGIRANGVAGPETWRAIHDPAYEPLGESFGTSLPLDDRRLTEELSAVARHARAIEAAAAESGLLPSVIAGLGSRRSRWGLALTPNDPSGTLDFKPRPYCLPHRPDLLPRDGGFGRGLMAVDHDGHEFARVGPWRDPTANVRFACRLVSDARALLRRRTVLHGDGLLRGALAAYSCGIGNVLRAARQGLDLDFYTVGRDFGRDVLDRAGFFQRHGWD